KRTFISMVSAALPSGAVLLAGQIFIVWNSDLQDYISALSSYHNKYGPVPSSSEVQFGGYTFTTDSAGFILVPEGMECQFRLGRFVGTNPEKTFQEISRIDT